MTEEEKPSPRKKPDMTDWDNPQTSPFIVEKEDKSKKRLK